MCFFRFYLAQIMPALSSFGWFIAVYNYFLAFPELPTKVLTHQGSYGPGKTGVGWSYRGAG